MPHAFCIPGREQELTAPNHVPSGNMNGTVWHDIGHHYLLVVQNGGDSDDPSYQVLNPIYMAHGSQVVTSLQMVKVNTQPQWQNHRR